MIPLSPKRYPARLPSQSDPPLNKKGEPWPRNDSPLVLGGSEEYGSTLNRRLRKSDFEVFKTALVVFIAIVRSQCLGLILVLISWVILCVKYHRAAKIVDICRNLKGVAGIWERLLVIRFAFVFYRCILVA